LDWVFIALGSAPGVRLAKGNAPAVIRQNSSLEHLMDSSSKKNGDATPIQGKRKRRYWARALLATVVLGAFLYGFRVPILRGVATYLIVDEPSAVADYVLVLPGVDRRYDRAAQILQAGSAASILLVERRPKRLERMGLLPSFESVSQHELVSRGVPASSITVIPGQTRTDWERARRLRAWLDSQPATRIVVLSERFGGRKLRYVLDKTLGADYAGRVRLLGLPERSYDENDWWRHREGVVKIFDAYLNLAYTRLCGEESEEWREWDPEQFKKTLR
jgi:uncharacterized SAM-binding protein YcdF (DUF218 family)